MKISKLFLLGMLASSLCMVGSTFGATISLSDGISPNFDTYNLGDTIEYVLSVENTGDVNLVDLDIYFFAPDNPPTTGICNSPVAAGGVYIGTVDLLEPDQIEDFNSTDNALLAWQVSGVPCDGDPTIILAYSGTVYYAQGSAVLRCDNEASENYVNPVDTPDCSILGPVVVCEGSDSAIYCSEFEADGYLWEVLGGAEIVGSDDANCVTVDPNGSGDYTVYLYVCNDNGGENCCTDCNLPVTVIEAPDCLIVGPNSVCASDSAVEFCSDVNDADSYYWEIISGDATISGSDLGDCVTVIPGTSAQFELKLSICYEDPNCCDSCTKVVDVISAPDCLIDGPNNVCVDSNTVYCSNADADTYLWEITGDGTIVGPNNADCVTVSVGATGSFLLTLTVCNIADTNDCCNTCPLEVTVEECGGGYCTFTQGFYGNVGGTQCGGLTTTQIINQAGLPVIVGALALDFNDVNGPSIIFNSAACIIERLPCGGKPRPLPDDLGNVDCNDTAALKAAKLLKGKDDRINNTLVGQTVALTLNMRLHTIPCMDANGFDVGLGDYVFPDDDYICVQQEEGGCIFRYAIPESLQGLPASAVLIAANMALAGDEELVDGAYEGASFINELFDECWTIVTCPVIDEICDNECDDDFDGLVDIEDPDCQI